MKLCFLNWFAAAWSLGIATWVAYSGHPLLSAACVLLAVGNVVVAIGWSRSASRGEKQ